MIFPLLTTDAQRTPRNPIQAIEAKDMPACISLCSLCLPWLESLTIDMDVLMRHLFQRRRTERRYPRREPHSRFTTATARRSMRRLRRRSHEASRVRPAFPLADQSHHGLLTCPFDTAPFMSLLSQTDRILPPSTTRRGRADRLSRLQLVGGAGGPSFMGFPFFTCAAANLGMGELHIEEMRRFVDHVLCSLSFEEPWYRERGVAAEYVGHPFFDDLPTQTLDAGFRRTATASGNRHRHLARLTHTRGRTDVLTQLRAAATIHGARARNANSWLHVSRRASRKLSRRCVEPCRRCRCRRSYTQTRRSWN